MRLSLFIVSIFLTIELSCQSNERIVLIDQISSDPVPYATIGAGSLSIFSDHNGYFSSDLIKSDHITISRLGYKELKLLSSEITDTIRLAPSPFILGTVEIRATEKRMEAGFHDMKTYGRTSGRITQGVGVEIKDIPKDVLISKVFVHTKGNKKGDKYLVSFFSIDSVGLPGELLYVQEYRSPNGRNQLSILIENRLKVDNEVIVVFDWVSDSDNNKEAKDYSGVRMTNQINESQSFLYAKVYNKWIRFEIEESIGFHWNYKIGIEYIEN